MSDRSGFLRELPAIDALLQLASNDPDLGRLQPGFLAAEARLLIADWRQLLLSTDLDPDPIRARLQDPLTALRDRVGLSVRSSLVPVINATGVVIHTNLGRAPWPERAIERAVAAARGYSNLEYDLASGERGVRENHVAAAARLFGAEAALVVNNNAAAVVLTLDTLARDRETVVSRGEMVEIGGSFRIPDILAKSNSKLREVGTTNRTRFADYERAIGPETAVLLKVHPSNYRVIGFTESVPIKDLAALAARHRVTLVEDLGSGAAVDISVTGVEGEPTVAASIAEGVDLVLFSGDKLLGGPQAGIIVGRAGLVKLLKANPLYRALRPDKVTIAALEEVFRIYLTGDPWSEIPVLKILATDRGELARRTLRLGERLQRLGIGFEIREGFATVGGGAAPLSEIPSPQLAIKVSQHGPSAIATWLRGNRPPIIARVADDRVMLDLRTVANCEDDAIVAALSCLIAAGADGPPAD